jgi:hypothetical protein
MRSSALVAESLGELGCKSGANCCVCEASAKVIMTAASEPFED